MVTQNSANEKTAASGKILQGQGVGTASDFSTATYPATTTANQLLYSSSTNTVGGLTSANNGTLVTSNTGVPSILVGGTANTILTANSGAAPSWQSPRGYTLTLQSTASGTPVDGTTYFQCMGAAFDSRTTNGLASSRMYIPLTGTITRCYGVITNTGTLGSSQTGTVAIRLNNTTDTNVSTSVATNATANTFNNSALSISVGTGDYVEVKFISPTWTPTNPTALSMSVTIYVA